MITIIFIAIAAVLSVGATVAFVHSRRESHRNQAIRKLANRLKFKQVKANGPERPATSISLLQHREYAFTNVYSGKIAGLAVTFFDMVLSQNADENAARSSFSGAEMTTRVRVHLKGQNLPSFILVPQAVKSTALYQLPKTAPITFAEDLNFTRDNILLSDQAESIRRLFGTAGLRALFANNDTTCVEGKRDNITVYCCNKLLSAGQLESLLQLAVKVAGALSVAPAPALQAITPQPPREPMRARASFSPA